MKLPELHTLPIPLKLLSLVVVAALALLGLIGLVLPIIPGVVFLFAALWLLSKLSTRFATMLDDSPRFARRMGFLRRTRGLSVGQRLRLSFWVMAKMAMRGMESIAGLFKSRRRPTSAYRADV